MGSDMNGYEESLSVFESYKIISIFLANVHLRFLGASHLLIKKFENITKDNGQFHVKVHEADDLGHLPYFVELRLEHV